MQHVSWMKRGIITFVILGIAVFLGCHKKMDAHQRAQKIIEKGKRALKHGKPKNNIRITAKEAYKVALKEASSWDKNAYLIQLDTFVKAEKDGKSDLWTFKFLSDSKQKVIRIWVNPHGVHHKEPTSAQRYKDYKKLSDKWFDSDKAIELASKYFKGSECRSYWLALSNDEWTVKCSRKKGRPVWVSINSLTGKFISKRTGY